MSKVMVLGISPLPFENEISLSGPGIRTWQFVKPVLEDGHEVCLICLQPSEGYKQKISGLIHIGNYKSLKYYSLSFKDFNELTNIQKIHDDFNPDCIFSLSSFGPSYAAVQLATGKPIWFDRGDIMAEAQIKVIEENNNDYLYNFWNLEEMVLERGDVFSAVSLPQRFSVIGRLGGAGRLNSQTLGYEFVHAIPCGIESGSYSHTKSIIRGKSVSEGDFVILWSGGYNNWTDIDTLFSGLEIAMSGNSRIKFVSTGGEISGQREAVYARFLRLIDGSKYKDRFIMLGWVATEDLANIYLESDLGINIDKYCYEVVLGSRHRLLDWMKAGLPILTTNFSELTHLLHSNKMVFTYPDADHLALAEKFLKLSLKKEDLLEYAQRAKVFVNIEFTYEITTKVFRDWVKDPKNSPDNINKDYSLPSFEQRCKENFLRKIESYRLELDNYKVRFSNLEADRLNLEAHISNLEVDRLNLEAHISNLEAEHLTFKTHISNLEAERPILKTHIANLEAEHLTFKTHISNLEAERQNFYARVSGLEQKLNSITSTRAYRLYNSMKKYAVLLNSYKRLIASMYKKNKPSWLFSDNIEQNHEDCKNLSGVVKSKPILIYAEISTKCNLHCSMCGRGNYQIPLADQGFMSRKVFDRLSTLFTPGAQLALFGRGETLLHPDFIYCLRLARNAGMRVGFNTNGLLLNEEIAKEMVLNKQTHITFSCSAGTPETYNKIHCINAWDKLWENIDMLNEAKRRFGSAGKPENITQINPVVYLEFVSQLDNISELPALLRLAFEHDIMGLMVIDVVAHSKELEKQRMNIPENSALADRYYREASAIYKELTKERNRDFDFRLPSSYSAITKKFITEQERDKLGEIEHSAANEGRSGKVNFCIEPWQTFYVRFDGTVAPCVITGRRLGDLNKNTAEEIWNGEVFQKFRLRMRSESKPYECLRCHLFPGPKRYNLELDDYNKYESL
ncbi:MAG: SPASM domain-containing protein [Candidatus Omnitrophica bacterium]|nr:SPASM domain-containing protein [Candidatus Omnitrophota bacterium]